MTARGVFSILAAAAILCGCSEPDDTIMGSTADGMYELTLSADPNWVRPNETLPVTVSPTVSACLGRNTGPSTALALLTADA